MPKEKQKTRILTPYLTFPPYPPDPKKKAKRKKHKIIGDYFKSSQKRKKSRGLRKNQKRLPPLPTQKDPHIKMIPYGEPIFGSRRLVEQDCVRYPFDEKQYNIKNLQRALHLPTPQKTKQSMKHPYTRKEPSNTSYSDYANYQDWLKESKKYNPETLQKKWNDIEMQRNTRDEKKSKKK